MTLTGHGGFYCANQTQPGRLSASNHRDCDAAGQKQQFDTARTHGRAFCTPAATYARHRWRPPSRTFRQQQRRFALYWRAFCIRPNNDQRISTVASPAKQIIDAPARRRPRRGEAREALMHAALELVSSETNFSALSLRHVARQAGVVPTDFYRNFDDMEALVLTLVENTFHSLRQLFQDARISTLPTKGLVHYSVALFAHYVRDNR